ncbi:MAG TPA: hypothetical protein VJ653_01335 [Acidimicrobiales bacterium]|nr:hypothetical protein [Acidimicrobiales bacterium]
MTRSRFVLRYRGDGPKPAEDVARVRGLTDAVVVDSTSRMLVVEAEPGPLRDLVDGLGDWVMGPDMAYEVPDTRKKVRRPPDP